MNLQTWHLQVGSCVTGCVFIYIYMCVCVCCIHFWLCTIFSLQPSLPRTQKDWRNSVWVLDIQFMCCEQAFTHFVKVDVIVANFFPPDTFLTNVLTNKQKSYQPSWSLVVIAKWSSRLPDSIAACDTLALLRFSLSAHLSRSGVDSGNSNRIWRHPKNQWRKKSAEVH